MFDGFSKREFIAVLGAVIIACALSAWGAVYVIQKYVIGERDDPLARAGGLKPEQMIQPR